MTVDENKVRFSAQYESSEEVRMIAETPKDCWGLSRTKLAYTIILCS